MKTASILFVLAAAAAAIPAAAQPVAGPAATSLDPASLSAAAKLIDVVMPPERREGLLSGMMQAMNANMRQAMFSNPESRKMFEDDPRVKPIVERFIERQQAEGVTLLRSELPNMITAMQRAYARRFTVPQMEELTRFFATPTGRLYMEQGQTIMQDPDVAAWQRSVAAKQFARMPEAVKTMQAEILALPPRK